MKCRLITNWGMLCVGCALIIVNRLVDMPALGWIGDILLILGLTMLPQTVAINKKTKAEQDVQFRPKKRLLSHDIENSDNDSDEA